MMRLDRLLALSGIVLLVSCGDSRVSGKPVVDETTNGFQVRLLSSDGSPSGLARVRIASSWRLAGDTDGVSISLASDANGVVDVPALPDGDYWIEAFDTKDGIRLPFRSNPATPAHDTSWQLLPLGTVTGSTTPYARIRAYGSDRTWTADARGLFRLEGVACGRWNLLAAPPGSDTLATEALAQVDPGKTDTASFSVRPIPDLSTWKNVFSLVLAPDPSASNDSLPDFAVPVRLDAGAFVAGLRSPDQMRILTPLGEPAPFRIESWDTAGRSAAVWAKLPAAHPRRGDTLFLVWGRTSLPPRQNPTETNSVYGVWNLDGTAPLANAIGNGPAISVDTATSDTTGVVGGARIMGLGSMMRLPPPRFEAFDSAFTISCWIDLEGSQHNHAKIFDLGDANSPFGTVLFDIDSSTGRPALQMAFADGTWKRVVARQDPSGWIHLAATWSRDARTARFYVDGSLQDTIRADTTLRSYTGHDLILGNQESGSDGIRGQLDEFRLDLSARPAAWIRHAWFSQRPGNSNLSTIR